jgi:hypothetical protein
MRNIISGQGPAENEAARRSRSWEPEPKRPIGTSNVPAYRQPAASQQAAVIVRLRRRRQIERIWRLGPRVVFELIDEIDRRHGLSDYLDQRLARYAGLDRLSLAAVGADRFVCLPVHTVPDDP